MKTSYTYTTDYGVYTVRNNIGNIEMISHVQATSDNNKNNAKIKTHKTSINFHQNVYDYLFLKIYYLSNIRRCV